MSPTVAALRTGLARGGIELRQTFTNGQDLWGYFFPAVALAITTIFMRGSSVPGTAFSLGASTLPSAVGMSIAFGGLASLASQLIVEREDGTLLRAKAIPHGMLSYLVGKIALISAVSAISVAVQLGTGLLFVDGLVIRGVLPWLTLIGVLALGLVATLPLGAIVGSMFTNPRNLGLVMLPFIALVGISGIFYPITSLPGWLQPVGQFFPVYWLGLGMRSALLPDSMAAVEIGHSWRHLETLGVLGLWAVLGLLIAPAVLRRMARRESGSSMAERRERVLQRSPR
jgi:ABC-2 type transport system permease protein